MELDLKALAAGLITAVVVSYAAHAHPQTVHDRATTGAAASEGCCPAAACSTTGSAIKPCPSPQTK